MIGKSPFSGQKCRSVLHSFRHGSSSPAGASRAPHASVCLSNRSRSPGRAQRSAPPAQPHAPACPWALAEEEAALPAGVAVWPPSSCCRKSYSIAPPGFFFLFGCRDDPLPQDGPCLPAEHCPCELVAELLRRFQVMVSLWPQACGPAAVSTGTMATHSLWSPHGLVVLWPSARAPQPPTVMLPLLGMRCLSRREPCTPRLPHPEARPPALPGTAPLSAGSAVPGHGSTRLWWAAAPCSLAPRFPAAPGAAEQPPSRRADGGGQERLVPALGWSVAAVPRGHSTRVGTAESPYLCCSPASRGRTVCLEQHLERRSMLQPLSCCTFSCSPAGSLRSGAGTVPCCVERPPPHATSMGVAELLLVEFGASFPSPGGLWDLLPA